MNFSKKIITIIIIVSLSFNTFSQETANSAIYNKIKSDKHLLNLKLLSKLSYVKEKPGNYKKASQKFENKEIIESRLSKLDTFVNTSYRAEIHNFIDFFVNTNRYEVEAMLGMAAVYLPEIEEAVNEYRLPNALKYLPMAESSLYPMAVSDYGGVGIWQLRYASAKIFGLKINTFEDERRLVDLSSKAAARYLKEMYNIYYDWNLAIAAFSCGPAVVNKAINRSGGKRDFWDIYELLPERERETLPAFIAIMYLTKYYHLYDISPQILRYDKNCDTVEVNKKLHLGQISEIMNIPINKLRELNLRYRQDIIHPAGTKAKLILPEGKKEEFLKLSDSIYNYLDTVFFKPEPDVVSPPEKVEAAIRKSSYTTKTIKGKTKIIYTVKSGDNLGFIANWYNIKVADIKYWNNIYRNKIVVGDKINIYVPENKVDYYKKINSMSFEQKQKRSGKKTISKSTKKSTAVKLDNNFVYYKVKSGDNLWTIAKKYKGISHEDLLKINGFSKKYTMYPGQYIKIKRK